MARFVCVRIIIRSLDCLVIGKDYDMMTKIIIWGGFIGSVTLMTYLMMFLGFWPFSILAGVALTFLIYAWMSVMNKNKDGEESIGIILSGFAAVIVVWAGVFLAPLASWVSALI